MPAAAIGPLKTLASAWADLLGRRGEGGEEDCYVYERFLGVNKLCMEMLGWQGVVEDKAEELKCYEGRMITSLINASALFE